MSSNIQGMDAALGELERLRRNLKAAQRRGEKKAADKIAAAAKTKAPGRLSAGIYVTQDAESTTIIGGQELAAYSEFGTGPFAEQYLSSQPEDVRDEAYKFYVNGQGEIPAKPFFVPAIVAYRDEIVPNVKEEIDKL